MARLRRFPPSPATASKIAIFGVVMRLFLYAPVGDSEAVRIVLGVIAFASIIFGNLMALSQTNIKRLLGYSSISHLGYLLVALIALQSGEMSMEAVGVYLAGYLFSSLGAFGVVSLMSSPFRGFRMPIRCSPTVVCSGIVRSSRR